MEGASSIKPGLSRKEMLAESLPRRGYAYQRLSRVTAALHVLLLPASGWGCPPIRQVGGNARRLCYHPLMPLLEIRNLSKIFPLGESIFGGGVKGQVRAVDDVSLYIESGETLGLVGESGSGKSTLGRLVLRLIQPSSGTVRFDGRDLLAANPHEMRRLRRDMQIIFQDPFGSLDPRMRVEEVIAEPLVIHERLTLQARRVRGAELLRAGGLDESARSRFPPEFCGGQRPRIGIARALALRP